MAKTIKFNLVLDNYPVRNIEELQEHFSIEDMLKYFDNGLLLRWLRVRGYEKEFAEVESIDKSLNRKEITKALVKIFEVSEMDDEDIEMAIGILTYLDEEKKLNEIYRKNAFAKKQVLNDYHLGYHEIITHMEEYKENLALLKADAIQMEREYFELFELNYYELYFRLVESAPKAIFAILTRDALRKHWIGEDANEKIYSSIKTTILEKYYAKKILGDDLKIVKRDTQAMWDPIERPEVEVMVIYTAPGTFVKNAGRFSEKLGNNDVNYKLLKFNGLEYQSNYDYYELLYMEV